MKYRGKFSMDLGYNASLCLNQVYKIWAGYSLHLRFLTCETIIILTKLL